MNAAVCQQACHQRAAVQLPGKGLDGVPVGFENLPLFFHGWGISYKPCGHKRCAGEFLRWVDNIRRRRCLNLTPDVREVYMRKSHRQVKPATTRRYYRVARSRISFIRFVLEAYDNVAVVSTVEPHEAIVRVVAAPGCEALVDAIREGFPKACQVRPVAEGGESGNCGESPPNRDSASEESAHCGGNEGWA